MTYELIITEKPSVAKKMADALADGKAVQKREGQVSYFLLSHKKKDIVVCSAVGHLYTVAEVGKDKWKYPSFDVKWELSSKVNKNAAFTKKYSDVIKKLVKDANEFTVATDYDIEGEVIGHSVIKYLCKQNDANRMKFSAMTKSDLIKSYENKEKTLNWGQVNAGTTRHELDWFYGINLSRALSSAIKKAGRFKILSAGRVQGPALKILCDKEKSIKDFISTPFWDLKLSTKFDSAPIEGEYEKNPIQDEKVAKDILEKTKKSDAKVSKITVRNFKQQPPHPFDLTSMQIEAYRLFGIQPKDTLSLLQELYIGGWTSYPRTSSQKLPAELGYANILTQLAKNDKYTKLANKLLDVNKKTPLKPNEGKKKDDAHPAIYPTGLIPVNIEGRQFKIYDLIVKRFMATFAKAATRENVKADLDVNGYNFISKGTRTIDKQWHEFYKPYVKLEEVELPPIKEGITLSPVKITKENKETKPPKRYTPASIIKELEKRGLGTKATRAQIVENLYNRGYLNAKSIAVTEIGLKICEVLDKYCSEILDEKLTRTIEDEMEDIRTHKLKPEDVKDHAKTFLTKTLDTFRNQEEQIGSELVDATILADTFGNCPKCEKGKMVLRRGKFGRFLACNKYPDCSTTLKVPAKGKLTAVDDEDRVEGKFLINVQLPRKGPQVIDLLESYKKEDADEREPVEGENEICDKCKKGKMVYRKGFYGAFLGCNAYPKCKNIKQIPKKVVKEE